METLDPITRNPFTKPRRGEGKGKTPIEPTKLDGPPLLHRVDEAAALIRVGISTMRAMIADGRIKSVKIGGKRRVPHDELTRIARDGL